ncbi:MAG: CPBP family intramembrane metalloprotease [Oscillospiraceae bacterium]|nr:CPBP family intramembrane metalloprotease [Oscillospiraceae bacterium]
MERSLREKILVWLPVLMLPAFNIILAIITGASYDAHNAIRWAAGAVAEELFFRGFLLKTIFLPRIKPVLAIILVSALFAAMHLINLRNGTPFHAILPQMLCAFCFSMWAGAVVWRKGSILIPLLAHVLLNATAVTEGSLIPVLASAVVLVDGILLMKAEVDHANHSLTIMRRF